MCVSWGSSCMTGPVTLPRISDSSWDPQLWGLKGHSQNLMLKTIKTSGSITEVNAVLWGLGDFQVLRTSRGRSRESPEPLISAGAAGAVKLCTNSTAPAQSTPRSHFQGIAVSLPTAQHSCKQEGGDSLVPALHQEWQVKVGQPGNSLSRGTV